MAPRDGPARGPVAQCRLIVTDPGLANPAPLWQIAAMLRILILLCLATPTMAQSPMTAAEFEA